MSDQYKAVLFDLDGTLLETLEDITFSMNETLKYFNMGSVDINDMRRLVGHGAKILAEGVLSHLYGDQQSPEMKELLLSKFAEIYRDNSTVRTKPYEGISDLLDWLAEKGILTGVLSNKPHVATLNVLQYYFPEHMFDFVAGYREGVPRKPNPAGIYEFCHTLGLNTSEVLFVGDSEVDLETGRNASVDCIGVLWGFRDKDTLLKCGAKALIDSPGEIKKFL